MTRVVVPRGQGSTNSSQSRSSASVASSSSAAIPNPPPLPSSQLPSSSIQVPRSPSPPSEEAAKDYNEFDSLPFVESQSTSSDTISRFLTSHCSEGKVKESSFLEGRSEDEDPPEGFTAIETDGREHMITRCNLTLEEGTREFADSSGQGDNGLLEKSEPGFGAEHGTLGFEVEELRMQQEDVWSQKIHIDPQRDGMSEGEEDTSHLVQSKSQGSSSIASRQSGVQFGTPLQPLGANSQTSSFTSMGGVEAGSLRGHDDVDHVRTITSPKVAEAAACSLLPAPSALPVPPTSRRGGTVGSSASGGSRSGGQFRKALWSIKAPRSPPHNSRSSSPRSYGEGDGYNSADEQAPWASGQTVYDDNDDREHQFEMELRRAKSLEVRRMAEDGNCLFRAVADQVYGDAEMHGETRQMCIDYMEKERDHFSQFVTESFSAYCKRKRRDKVYGNNLEIQAMAEMYNRPIHIYCYGTEPKNIFQGSYETDSPPIQLSYHSGKHYNSLVDPSRSTVGAGLGFGSLHGASIDRDQVKAAIKAQQDLQIDKALLAEGRYYSDLELTEQEMERMVIEASRAEFLAEERRQQIGCVESSTSAAGTSYSQGDVLDRPQSDRQGSCAASLCSPSPANSGLTSNMRMLLSMGFSYFRVIEACSIFGDDINDMICYLLEAETGDPMEESLYRMKGKAAER